MAEIPAAAALAPLELAGYQDGSVVSRVLLRVAAGEMVLVPANEPHALSAHTRFKMLLTMMRSA
jgi:hypothetical protein